MDKEMFVLNVFEQFEIKEDVIGSLQTHHAQFITKEEKKAQTERQIDHLKDHLAHLVFYLESIEKGNE